MDDLFSKDGIEAEEIPGKVVPDFHDEMIRRTLKLLEEHKEQFRKDQKELIEYLKPKEKTMIEILTKRDCDHHINGEDLISLEQANKKLNKMFQKGYAQVAKDDRNICRMISIEKYEEDTHEAYVFLRPIVEEKPECQHETSFMGCVERAAGWLAIDGRVKKADFCPKCGKDLRDE